jgi:hypothetical protein
VHRAGRQVDDGERVSLLVGDQQAVPSGVSAMPAGNGLIFSPAGVVVGSGIGVPSVSVPPLTV